MANIATTPEDPQHFHVFKTEKREKKLQNQSRFELWRGTGTTCQHGAWFWFYSGAGEAVWVAVEVAVSTVDHPDIRGFEPHNRDPSGAASDYERGLGPKTCRIGTSRILLFVCSSAATHAASCAPATIDFFLTPSATMEKTFSYAACRKDC